MTNKSARKSPKALLYIVMESLTEIVATTSVTEEEEGAIDEAFDIIEALYLGRAI